MLTYIILVFPVAWMLDKYGMKLTVTIAACCNAAGAALKLAGTGEPLSTGPTDCLNLCVGIQDKGYRRINIFFVIYILANFQCCPMTVMVFSPVSLEAKIYVI